MARSKFWPALKPGDLVDVVAPGFGAETEGAAKYLQGLGLKARITADLFGDDPICCNTDDSRFKHLQKALFAKDSRAIWCIRGGYGALRILPALAKLTRAPRTKVFIGYSDATSLHYFLQKRWKWATLHGPLLDRLGEGTLPADDIREMEEALFAKRAQIVHTGLKPLNKKAVSLKKLKASVTGGNLTVTASHAGTPFMPPTKDRIIFFEDTGERGYRIDRCLKQLELAGFFKKAAAVVFGEFVGGKERDGSSKVDAAIGRFADQVKFPVFSGMQAGHGDRQRLVPLGTETVLTGGRSGEIRMDVGFE